MGITEGKIWYFCHSNRMMGWQSVNRVPSGVQLGQELTFGLIIWGSSPKGETHLLHTHLFNVWHQCTVRGMTDTMRGQPWEVPGPGDLKSSDLHGQTIAVVPVQGVPRRNHNAEFHMIPARYPKHTWSEGAFGGIHKGLSLGQGCLRVYTLHVCDEWRCLGIIPFFAANFFLYKLLNELYVNWLVSYHPLCSPQQRFRGRNNSTWKIKLLKIAKTKKKKISGSGNSQSWKLLEI